MKKSALFFAISLALAPAASADIFSGVTSDNNLVTFDSSAPNTLLTSRPVTGLTAGGGNLINLTYNPADGLYYGLDFAANFYSIDSTGAATAIPTTFAPSGFGALAFDPTGGNLVYVSELAEHFTLTTTGTATRVADFAYSAGDAHAGETPALTAAAFDPDFGTPYFIDFQTDSLVTNVDLNLGSADTVGPLGGPGFDITSNAALVVDSVGNLYGALSTDGISSSFYSIDPATGAATSLGALTVSLSAISAAAAVPEPSAALSGLAALGACLGRRRRA
ncbi:MAG: DUF4394 domain-containing protein [Verrucomicrobiota bacterium]